MGGQVPGRVSDEQLAVDLAWATRREEMLSRHGFETRQAAYLRELQGAREALRYLFAAHLPTLECNGPRDCGGTSLGCSHCVRDARLESARALGGGS